MIYYQFALEHNMIIKKPRIFDFLQMWHIHSKNKTLFSLEMLIYLVVIRVFNIKSFNINDDWSTKKNIYKMQINIIKKFYKKLYGK